jgi:energy-coupling factor transporter ATP-binding protein EcfA2
MQRTVIAAMLVLEPDLWLLDEPTSALDTAGRRLVHDLLRAESARGAAVVIASEDADGLAAVADRLVVFEAGRPVLDGRPDLLLRGEPVWEAGAASTTIAALARAAGVDGPRPLTVAEGVARWAR